ncbi:glycine betaine ABC transporter substrate-binding protein [Mesorhizobium sp.]|uniref:glycine betaine ABC transporter substrate-binding protein n=1 Tax=Mesorhizobium sp. TaxID=1871066 RepID=UPI000FE66098|nr:glycine betaine ABC transporter substrate-binding protein [Mesorhizobium sp.]RWB66280.1 MAG: ABC transporter substrate-binding protein [Mesorhizobium sp.]
MKRLLTAASILLPLAIGARPAFPAECGNITIADVVSQSSDFLTNLDKLILNTGYGCKAEVTQGGTVPSITSLIEKGEPNVVSEAWIDLTGPLVPKGVSEGRAVLAAPVLSEGGVIGWYIPKYLADAHPDIKTFADALKHPELFPDPEDPSRGAITNGPQGWGMTVAASQLYKAYNAKDAGFTLVDTGSAAGLDASIAKAYERKQGWLGAYWAPTALLAKYAMVQLKPDVPVDEAEYKRCTSIADCPDPKKTAWPNNKVFTLVASKFAGSATPEVMTYLKAREFTNDELGKVLLWMTDNQATGEQAAQYFIKTYPDLWKRWVSSEAAKKIEASH